MSIPSQPDCATIEPELVAYARQELDADLNSAVASHVARCDACAGALTDARKVVALVGSVEIEPRAEASAALMAAIDAELAAVPAESAEIDAQTAEPPGKILPFPKRMGELLDYAQYRYETSTGVRRFVGASIIAHAAAVGFLTWALVGGHLSPRRNVKIVYEIAEGDVELDASEAEEDPGSDDHWSAQNADPGNFDSDDLAAGLPYPSQAVKRRLAHVVSPQSRRRALRISLGAELAERVPDSMDQGLAWLAGHQDADGTWSDSRGSDRADAATRTGVTATAVLAYSVAGRSALTGEDSALLGPAVAHLESWVKSGLEGTRDADASPVASDALALRALAWQYALDFRRFSDEERHARRDLLRRGGASLVAAQATDGGFGASSASTVAAVEALEWLRAARVLDTQDALTRAGAFLAQRRADADGVYSETGGGGGDLTLTAAVLALGDRISVSRAPGELLDRIAEDVSDEGVDSSQRLGADRLADSLLALRRHQRSVRPAARALLAGQGDSGAWSRAPGGDADSGVYATAMAVVGLGSTYAN